jgi:hypothetical protein
MPTCRRASMEVWRSGGSGKQGLEVGVRSGGSLLIPTWRPGGLEGRCKHGDGTEVWRSEGSLGWWWSCTASGRDADARV